jgi:hypothetical protein
MRIYADPGEEAFKVRYETNRERTLWLAGYGGTEPEWSSKAEDAIWTTEKLANQLRERFGLSVFGGKLRLITRPPKRETHRLKEHWGHDYWEHKLNG